MEIWRKRTGEAVGIADVYFGTPEQRKEAQGLAKELRPTWNSRQVYLNSVMPDLSVAMDKPLKEAYRSIKSVFVSDNPKNLNINYKTRSVRINEMDIVTQNPDTLQCEWKISVSDCYSETAARLALQAAGAAGA